MDLPCSVRLTQKGRKHTRESGRNGKYMDWLMYHRDKIPSGLSPRGEVAETSVWPCRSEPGPTKKGQFLFGQLG